MPDIEPLNLLYRTIRARGAHDVAESVCRPEERYMRRYAFVALLDSVAATWRLDASRFLLAVSVTEPGERRLGNA
jgi:hypothetical protein